jgi:KDO2-lipid IV(A) lauroyltransferase
VVREKEGYKGIISQPLVVTDERGEHEALGRVVKMLEKYIIMYPDQWYNFVPV